MYAIFFFLFIKIKKIKKNLGGPRP